jgi:hypothetical protein
MRAAFPSGNEQEEGQQGDHRVGGGANGVMEALRNHPNNSTIQWNAGCCTLRSLARNDTNSEFIAFNGVTDLVLRAMQTQISDAAASANARLLL